MGATTQTLGSGDPWTTFGNRRGVFATVTMSGSYSTGGDTVTAASFGLVTIDEIEVMSQPAGYVLEFDKTNLKIKAYRTATLTPAGTVAAPTFTGTAPITGLNYATPAFTGTGLTASGQAMTTTDAQTMTVNQCAGMFLLAATAATPPMLIVSNTAVTAAAAVLTVIGAAATDAGAYKVLKTLTPIGTNSAPTLTGTATTAAALAEVGSTVSLSAVVARVFVIGW